MMTRYGGQQVDERDEKKTESGPGVFAYWKQSCRQASGKALTGDERDFDRPRRVEEMRSCPLGLPLRLGYEAGSR